MSEYIEVERLKQEIAEYAYTVTNLLNVDDKGLFVEDIDRVINSQPSIDIIHCEDCANFICEADAINGTCLIRPNMEGWKTYTPRGFFCGSAVRKQT